MPRADARPAMVLCRDERLCRLLEIELTSTGYFLASPEDESVPPHTLLVAVDGADLSSFPAACPRLIIGRSGDIHPTIDDAAATARLPRPFSLVGLESALRHLSSLSPAPASDATSPASPTAPPPESAPLSLAARSGVVTVAGRPITLSPAEWTIFSHLYAHRGELVTRAELASLLSGGGNSVDVYICHLRRKLEKPLSRRLIESVRGQGYRLL